MRLRGLVQSLGGPLRIVDICVSMLFLPATLLWLRLAADMLADRIMSSTSAYVIVFLGFVAMATFITVPLLKKLVASGFWLSAKLFTAATSLGLGLYCSLFHRTSFWGPVPEKGYASFAQVFRLRRDPEWLTTHHWWVANVADKHFYARIIYMVALVIVALAVAAMVILRYAAARRDSVIAPDGPAQT